ncbi:hypothetical protein HYH03_006937 [Edaphochlamys debaryana]|uniref:Uncharacterized protein n=1 Tax=Edaphochlamys debaryana TaxID=47281 RepID=A0A835YCI5_9CHLO|nr:hypothetical protein HYH03_006937 [Edaphochlamys debaryana]|eukprot:KAG2495004.1 hypothetical protein HYH03_006937 [Edaphochlamys debaryana]
MAETVGDIQKMLVLVEHMMRNDTMTTTDADADKVLSYFAVRLQCGTQSVEHKEYIESLVSSLRHPYTTNCTAFVPRLPPPMDIFNDSYMLLAARQGAFAAPRNNFYLDAGAGVGWFRNRNQFWVADTYKQRGLKLDRAIYWEAKRSTGSFLVRGVPSEYFPAFTFYNVPVPADIGDGRNILNVLTKLAKPEDFVSIKIDIDMPYTESDWIAAIIGEGPGRPNRSVYAQLIDELFWEEHFRFRPMQDCCWMGRVDRTAFLFDALRTFQKLRYLGVRSHGWQ